MKPTDFKVAILSLLFMLVHVRVSAQVVSFEIDSSKFQKQLLPVLDSIYKADQLDRWVMMKLMKNKASQHEIDSTRSIIKANDKQNLVKVERILSRYGWLGPQDVEINGSQALFLVIQHADLPTQQKYITMIRDAEKEGKILSSNLAILEDRIAVREGRRQLYGSQGFTDADTGQKYVYPIADPDNLDKRRASMGLIPMREYVKDWDLAVYKNLLPQIEEKAKVQNAH